MAGRRSGESPGITFLDGPLAGRTIALTRPRLTLGRTPSNDIPLDYPGIAPEHAVLTQERPPGWAIQARCPGTSLLVNGRAIVQAPLTDHDVVALGLVRFQFFAVAPATAPGAATRDTLVGSRGTSLERASVPQQLGLAGVPAVVTIGRAADNTIQLNHPLISWHHAALRRDLRSGKTTLIDTGSTNGTFVNGRRIRGRVQLAEGDEVTIGPYRPALRGTELIQRDERAAIRVDAYQLFKAVVVSRWRQWLRLSRPKVLLDHISLSIPPHSFVALVGGSGTGKTMLLDALSGLRPAQQGLALYNGVDAYRYRGAFSTL